MNSRRNKCPAFQPCLLALNSAKTISAMGRNFFCVSLLILVVIPLWAQAPADSSQEGAVIEKIATHRHFESDGGSTEEVTASIHVQSEAGVEEFGQLVFGYSSATEKLTVDYVRVKKNSGEVVNTPESNAQDLAPEVLVSAPMYSDFRQRHITVAGLRPGDVLEYHTTTVIQPLAKEQFWYEYSFPTGLAINEARLDIDVPKSRDIHLKSPKQKYTTTQSGDFKTYSWSVKNLSPKRPKRNGDTDEADSEAEDETPDVQVSSFRDWQEVASWYAKLQGERVLIDDSIRSKALDLTKSASTRTEKAQKLYDYVAKDIRYVSLSFGVGRLQPHAAPEVLMGSYGDCKDKHTLLSALLRAVGIESYPVLIGSERKLDEDVPSPAQFDHVITAARIDKDLTFLDTTAEVAPFGLILYQLRDKQALIAADAPTGGVHKTPTTVPVKNTVAYTLDGKFSELGTFDAGVDLAMNGDSAVLLRMIFRRAAPADWPRMVENLARFQGTPGELSKVEIAALEDPSKPLHIRYALHKDVYFSVPSEGDAFYPFPQIGIAQIGKPKRGETIDVGPAVEVHNKAHIQFAGNYSVTVPPETRISREYGEFRSSFRLDKKLLDVTEDYILSVNRVPASRRSDVDSLRSVATNRAAQAITCSVLATANETTVAAVGANATPDELRKQAATLLARNDFRNAAELLKRLVQQSPSDPDAWDTLGRAYSGMGDHDNAVTAFRKQVEVNSTNARAYDDLGAELRRQGKYDEAMAAYSKQLENNPTDREARKNHALVLAQLKHTPEAIGELEALSAAPPRDFEVDLVLADLYGKTGSAEKAKTLLQTIIGSPALPPGGDLFAAALRDDIDPEATVREANEILSDVGDQFDDGAYKSDPEAALPAMQFVALEWARIGWADVLKDKQVEGVRYLESAWKLSQSGTVANRLARIYERGSDTRNAKALLTMAIVAGGSDVQDSRTRLAKLGGSSSQNEPTQAERELSLARAAKINSAKGKSGQAEFLLTFDGSSRPDRVEFKSGDSSLQQFKESLLRAEYPVSFPDLSSLKIVRRGILTCQPSGCQMIFKPLEPVSF